MAGLLKMFYVYFMFSFFTFSFLVNCRIFSYKSTILLLYHKLYHLSSILNKEKLIAELITPFKKFNSLALNTSNNFITIIILIPQTMVSLQIRKKKIILRKYSSFCV